MYMIGPPNFQLFRNTKIGLLFNCNYEIHVVDLSLNVPCDWLDSVTGQIFIFLVNFSKI